MWRRLRRSMWGPRLRRVWTGAQLVYSGLVVPRHPVGGFCADHERLPLATVTRKTRDFARTDRTDISETHLSKPARAGDLSASRSAQVFVDYFNLAPTHVLTRVSMAYSSFWLSKLFTT
jgi:hypothetical protein